MKVEGTVTADGKHINWQDSTSYWTRGEVYRLEAERKK